MGCCFSGEDENGSQGQPNERSPLLRDSSAPIANGGRTVEDGGLSSSGPMSKTDEQSMLNRILHQTANDVIDVSTVEPHSLERTEYMERSRQYMSKISHVNGLDSAKGGAFASGTGAMPAILGSDPVPDRDIGFAIQAAKGAEAALSGFHVEHRESIVVQFGADT